MSDWTDPKPEDEDFPFAMDGVEVLGEGFQTFDTTAADEADALQAEADAFFADCLAGLVESAPKIQAHFDEWPNQPTAAEVAAALGAVVVGIQNETMHEAMKAMAGAGDPSVLVKAITLVNIIERIPQAVALLVAQHTNPDLGDA